ncbi:Acylphosphatase-like protein [Drosera capensis]
MAPIQHLNISRFLHSPTRSIPFSCPRNPLRYNHLNTHPLQQPRISFNRIMMSQSDSAAASQDITKSVRCVIKGRVQGVFYRDWTVQNATQLELNGWVRNRRDGSVEALFSGKPENVDEMLRRCRHGPPDSIVTGFKEFPWAEGPVTGFERKPTI